MIFKRAGVRYSKTPEPSTPYQAAGQVWDERIGSARVQSRNWQRMAACSSLLSVAAYEITGDQTSWRPVRVFDDGQKVYLQFPADIAQGNMPPLFIVGDKSQAELVNYRVHAQYYIVDRLFDVAELRLGGKSEHRVRIERTATGGTPAGKHS